MKIVLKLLHWIYIFYAGITFVTLMVIVFVFTFIASFFGKIRGGNAIYRICIVWADIWYFLIGISHRNIYETPLEDNKQYIFVANHISYLDAPMIMKSLRRPIRVLGKMEMQKIPIFGFIYKNAIVTVDRRNAARRGKSVRILKSVLKKGISIFIFPEGTFNETGEPLKKFYDGAFRIAIETRTAIRPLLFLDAHARMDYHSMLSLNPGISRTIFLDEVDVSSYTIKDVQKLKDLVYAMMEEKLLEYRVSWVDGRNQSFVR